MSNEIIAAGLPPVEKGSSEDKLIILMNKYRLPDGKKWDYNPTFLYASDRIRAVIQTIGTAIREDLEKTISRIKKDTAIKGKGSGEKREEQIALATKEHTEALKSAEDYIKGFVKDYKKRVDTLKEKIGEEEFKKFVGGKNIKWLDEPEKTSGEFQKIFNKELEEIERQKGQTKVELSKFKDVYSDMLSIQGDIENIVKKLKSTSMKMPEPKEQSSAPEKSAESFLITGVDLINLFPSVDAELEAYKKRNTADNAIMKAVEEWPAKKEQIEKETELKTEELKKQVEEIKSEKLDLSSNFSPVLLANIAIGYLKEFRKLYLMYHSTFWAHVMEEQQTLQEQRKFAVNSDVTIDDLKSWHKEAIDFLNKATENANSFIRISPKSPDLSSKAKKVEKDLEEFASSAGFYLNELQKYNKTKKEASISLISNVLKLYAKENSPETGSELKKEYEKDFNKEHALKEFKKIEDKKIQGFAEEELDKVYKFFEDKYINPPDSTKSLAEKEKMDPRALIINIANAVVMLLIKKWITYPKQQKAPSKSIKYPEIEKKIDDKENEGVIPVLGEHGESVAPAETRPTSEDILEKIKNTWMHLKPKEMIERYENEHFEGGGGSSGKSRAPVPKLPVPEVLQMEIDQDVYKVAEGKEDGKEYVDKKIDKMISNVGEAIEAGKTPPSKKALVNGIVIMLKQVIPNSVRHMRVLSKKGPKLLTEGPGNYRQRSTPADIKIPWGEAEKIWDRIVKMYEYINDLIGENAVYTGKDSHKISMPYWLAETVLREQEDVKKSSLYFRPIEMSQRIAHKYIIQNMDQDVDFLPESNLVIR